MSGPGTSLPQEHRQSQSETAHREGGCGTVRPGAGHGVPQDQPDAFWREVNAFLKEPSRPSKKSGAK